MEQAEKTFNGNEPAQTTTSPPAPTGPASPTPTDPATAEPAPHADPAARQPRRPRKESPDSFHPTRRMQRYAEALCERDGLLDEEERCRRAGIGLRGLKRWRRHEEFDAWLDGEVRHVLARRMVQVWNGLLAVAMNGNVPAAKVILAELGRQEAAVTGPNTFYELAELAALAEKEEKEKNQAHEEGGESYN
jgi:hypothetical protein